MTVSIGDKTERDLDDTADTSYQLLTSNDLRLECVTETDGEADNKYNTLNDVVTKHDVDAAIPVSMERSTNERSDSPENISTRNRVQKSQQRTLRRTQDKAISQVVPAYYQAAMLSRSRR